MSESNLKKLIGGEELDVRFFDGKTETVFVRTLPIAKMQKLADCLGDEPARVELFCSKEKGWAENLTVESHEKVLELGEKFNSENFTRWVGRLEKRVGSIAPTLTPLLEFAKSAALSAPGAVTPSRK